MSGMDYVSSVKGENGENSWYIKRKHFPFIVSVVRKYIRLFIPMAFSVFTVRQALPFFSDGPIYLVSLKVIFWNQCEGSGLFNMTLL